MVSEREKEKKTYELTLIPSPYVAPCCDIRLFIVQWRDDSCVHHRHCFILSFARIFSN